MGFFMFSGKKNYRLLMKILKKEFKSTAITDYKFFMLKFFLQNYGFYF